MTTVYPIDLARDINYFYNIAQGDPTRDVWTPPPGGFVLNNEAEFDQVIFDAVAVPTMTWADVIMYNDDAYTYLVQTDLIPNWFAVKADAITTASRSFTPTTTRSVGTAFQISTFRDALIFYSATISCAATLLVGSAATMTVQYADDSAMTTHVVTLPPDSFGVPTGLVSSVNSTLKVSGIIPKGKWVKIVPVNTLGTPTIGTLSVQEVLI